MWKNYSFATSLVLVSLIVLITIFIGCSTIQPVRSEYPLPDQNLESWESIFDFHSNIDSFKILKTGSVKVPVSGMLNMDKLPDKNSFGREMWVDVLVYLFHHKSYGWFMIDTGLDSSFLEEGNIHGLMAGRFIKDIRQKKGENIASQLTEEGKKIQAIFLTHLHGDHTAGLPEIDPAIKKVAGKGDVYHYTKWFYYSNHFNRTDTVFDVSWNGGTALDPFDSVVDIFGDRSFLGLYTPGHSEGHMSFVLRVNDQVFLLTGDASHTKFGFENNIEPGWVDSQMKAEKSLVQLRSFKNMYPFVQVIYGHELD